MCDCLQNWGSISDQITQIQEFLESLEKFISVLSGANSSLQGRVELSDHDHSTLLDSLKTPADYVMAGTGTEITLARSPVATGFCFGRAENLENYFVFARMASEEFDLNLYF